jgi:hypothetical protein
MPKQAGDDSARRELVNRSGFVFQLAVETQISATRGDHEWSVLSSEHAWEDNDGKGSGYIDLILGRSDGRLVVECKKRNEKSWVFLCPAEKGRGNMSRARIISTTLSRGQSPKTPHHLVNDLYYGWDYPIVKSRLIASAPEAGYCVMQDDRVLEGIARNLLLATEAVAVEEIPLQAESVEKNYPRERSYIPLIVTNAQLFVCRFKAAEVSLAEPFLKGSEEYEEVPLVMFSKSLAPPPSPRTAISDSTLAEINRGRERTVLVASSENLPTTLAKLAGGWHW